MNWYKASIKNIELLQKCALNNKVFGNNYSSINSFLYEAKFNSQICIENNWLFEKCFENNQPVYTFPHNIDGDNSEIKWAVEKILEEAAASCAGVVFKNITLEEKLLVAKYFPSAKSEEVRQYSDYIYLTENLAMLPGGTYSKKRNHVNQFGKKHENYHFELLNADNLKIPYQIEEKWLVETLAKQEAEEIEESLRIEKEIISTALNNFEYLKNVCGMSGGILFVDNEPAAFCLSSLLSFEVTDIHFEKCLASVAKDGGYAVINQLYAKTIETKFINREEDLGIEGLRKAKLSYYPQMIVQKFNVKL